MAKSAQSFVPGLSDAVGTATAASNAATLNSQTGIITSEALTTAAGATYTCTLTNSFIGTGSNVLVIVGNPGTGTAQLVSVTPAAGSVAIIVANKHASAAFNSAITLQFLVI